MTTNQTIDGVPRELLERALRELLDWEAADEFASVKCTHDELRALLDAERCTSCDDSGDLIDLTGEWRGYCACPAGVALKNKPASLLDAPAVEADPDNRHLSVLALHDVMQSVPSSSLYSLAEAVLDAGYTKDAQTQGEPVACSHEWTDDGEFLLVCTACGAQEDHTKALQLAFELGGTDDGSYHLEADELCEVMRLYAEQPAPVATISRIVEAIHDISGFPGITGTQIRQLAERLNAKPR